LNSGCTHEKEHVALLLLLQSFHSIGNMSLQTSFSKEKICKKKFHELKVYYEQLWHHMVLF